MDIVKSAGASEEALRLRAVERLRLFPSSVVEEYFATEYDKDERISAGILQLSLKEFFFCYLDTHNRAVLYAHELLISSSYEKLLALQEDLLFSFTLSAERTEPLELIEEDEAQELPLHIRQLNAFTALTIVEASQGKRPQLIELAAVDLALMALRTEAQHTWCVNQLNIPSVFESLYSHKSLMEKALKNRVIEELKSPEALRKRNSQIAAAFKEVLEEKARIFNCLPPVILVNDVDNNLGINAHNNSGKPSDKFDLYIDELEQRVPRLLGRQRVPLIHRSIVGNEVFYEEAGEKISFFDDIQPLVRHAHALCLPFIFLTANLSAFARGVARKLGISSQEVIFGQEIDAAFGPEKPIFLLELMIKVPEAIVIFSDDGDRRIVESAVSGTVLPELAEPLPLHSLVFLAARETHAEERVWPCAKTFTERQIPYVSNWYEKVGEQTFGYQGVSTLVEAYGAWKAGVRAPLTVRYSPDELLQKIHGRIKYAL